MSVGWSDWTRDGHTTNRAWMVVSRRTQEKKLELASDPADGPKYLPSFPWSPMVIVPIASMDSIGFWETSLSFSGTWPFSIPNLIASKSSRSRGWGSFETPDWNIAKASSNCLIRWPIWAILAWRCAVSASTNLGKALLWPLTWRSISAHLVPCPVDKLPLGQIEGQPRRTIPWCHYSFFKIRWYAHHRSYKVASYHIWA